MKPHTAVLLLALWVCPVAAQQPLSLSCVGSANTFLPDGRIEPMRISFEIDIDRERGEMRYPLAQQSVRTPFREDPRRFQGEARPVVPRIGNMIVTYVATSLDRHSGTLISQYESDKGTFLALSAFCEAAKPRF